MSALDLNASNIVAYTGTDGTYSTSSTTYPANEIPANAFYNPNAINGNNSLVSVVMPLSTTSIGNSAFYECVKLTSVSIPSAVTNIGVSAFGGCSKLNAITVESGNLNYSTNNGVLFNKNQSTLIQYPGAIIGSYIIPSTVTVIADYAFSECVKLTSVTIPSSVTSIGVMAFNFCNGLTSVAIPASVSTIGLNAFRYCSYLTAITVESNNLNYSGNSGVLFNKNQSMLIQYPGGKSGSYIIPGTVTSIGEESFELCFGLTSVTIPSSVTSIGKSAFYYCSGLTSITIPSGVTSIGDATFYHCNGLKSVTIPSSVTTIGNYSFYYSGLTSVTIPSGVTSIGDHAFESCNSLTSVTIPSSVTTFGTYAFAYCSSLTAIYLNSKPIPLPSSYVFYYSTSCTLYVPYGTKTLYATANYWSSFTNIVESSQGYLLGSNTAQILNVVGSTTTVNLKANVAWTASSDQSWLTVNPGSGTGNATLTLTSVSQSQTFRTATVTVSSPGYASQTITVTETNSITITYCTAGSTATTYEYISNVAIGSINQASGRGTAGYEDYTSQITTMQKGVNTSATITATDSYSADQVIIWIDWNQDGVFDEVTEKVYASTGSFASPHTTANFAPPAGAKTGMTRMRIRLHDTGAGPNATSCGTSSWGEVEDYSVNVINATAVPTVIDGGSIQIVPNPVMDTFKIDGIDGNVSVSLVDLNGRELLPKHIYANESISVGNLSKGIYIVRIITNEGTVEKKLIKY